MAGRLIPLSSHIHLQYESAMHLYSGTTEDFIADALRNRLAVKLSDEFFEHFRYRPPQSEVHSWQNSLRAMADVIGLANLTDRS
jgi:hypothetical protein